MPESDDGYTALALQAFAGDEVAFRRLTEVFGPRLWGLFRRRSPDPQVAEDLTQEVWCRVWANRARFDPARGTFEHWVLRIARNLALDQAAKTRPVVELPADLPDKSLQPLDRLAQAEFAERVAEYVEQMDPQKAGLVQMRLAGLSDRQIADQLGEDLNRIRGRVHRAMTELAALLEPYR